VPVLLRLLLVAVLVGFPAGVGQAGDRSDWAAPGLTASAGHAVTDAVLPPDRAGAARWAPRVDQRATKVLVPGLAAVAAILGAVAARAAARRSYPPSGVEGSGRQRPRTPRAPPSLQPA